MENLLAYITFALLFLVFRLTMLTDCETYDDIDVKKVKCGLVRTFLRIRRFRGTVGFYLLCICAFRFAGAMILVPVLNFVCQVIQTDMRFTQALASNGELWAVSGISALLLALYGVERRVQRQMIEDFHEEE